MMIADRRHDRLPIGTGRADPGCDESRDGSVMMGLMAGGLVSLGVWAMLVMLLLRL